MKADGNALADVICDVCGESTCTDAGVPQFGTMHASWGQGSTHCGEQYELHLCEHCFFGQLAIMKRTRWVGVMFEDEGDAILRNDAWGRVSQK